MRTTIKPKIEWKHIDDKDFEKNLSQAYNRIFDLAFKNLQQKKANDLANKKAKK